MQYIDRYFPDIEPQQREQFQMLEALYTDWNEKINVISRRDITNLYLHHVVHSLAIAKVFHPQSGTRILDFGTGGGFPGVPLAIMFPEAKFHLIDGTGKKIHVAGEVIRALGLKNCTAEQKRGEEERGEYDFVVSRAVMPLPDMLKIVRKNISKKHQNSVANGIFCLKGGDLTHELQSVKKQAEKTSLTEFFEEEWFNEKYVVYLPVF